jgi:hypothetical protein
LKDRVDAALMLDRGEAGCGDGAEADMVMFAEDMMT